MISSPGFSPLTFVLQVYTIFCMSSYPTPRPVRLEDDDLIIVQRIKDDAPAGQTVSFSDAIRVALRFWANAHPVEKTDDV